MPGAWCLVPGCWALLKTTPPALTAHRLEHAQTIYFIEGGGQTGYDTCWGNGFVTDYNLINQYGLSDPNPFFQTLLTKPYRNKVRRHTV